MGKKRTATDWLNDATFQTLYNHYRNLCINQFEWEGLPEGITERYIENTLFDQGKALFFQDPKMSYMCLPCFQGSNLDVYHEPLKWRAQGLNYNKEYRREDCVLIENNKLRTPTHDMVQLYVYKLYETERTMDTALQTAKIPWLILCDEKEVLTYKRILEKVSDNEPAIFGSKGWSPDALQLLPTRTQFVGNELMDFSRSVENRLLTFIGVDNCPVDKKERLVTGEVSSNDEVVSINADLMLEARQRACEQINEKYGLSVSVKRRHEPQETEVQPDESLGQFAGNA